jgi:hypothetical protein
VEGNEIRFGEVLCGSRRKEELTMMLEVKKLTMR